MKVAAVQCTTGLDKPANRRLASTLVARAAEAGADLVVLPEATMATFGEAELDLVPFAEPLDGPFVECLTAAARSAGTQVVAGMFETAPGGRRVYNTVVAVGPQGLLGAYRKFHLYDALGWQESARIEAGDPRTDPLLVFTVDDLTVGVMNCYDLRFPEMARVLVDQGATALVVPAHFVAGPHKADNWEVLLRARAIENDAYVVAAGKPGPECTGHSMVVDPRGVVMQSLGSDDEGLVSAKIAAVEVDGARRELPVLENRRFSVQPRP